MRHAPLSRRGAALLLSARGAARPSAPPLRRPHARADMTTADPSGPAATETASASASVDAAAAASRSTASAAAEAVRAPALPPLSSRQLLSVAPMMDWTDVHYRQLARLISKHTWLYTEMVVDQTVIHTNVPDRHLWFPPEQRPIVCQLGGSNPQTLRAAARIVGTYGYDEINLNCGCPSDRVAGAGCFGAAMMLRPELVAECCAAVASAVGVPVTVKCRIGVDSVDSYEALHAFVAAVVAGSPVRHFIVHARKCHLRGLNPHQNRTVPPLRYGWVAALARDFPGVQFSLNGGVEGLVAAGAALRTLRAAAAGSSSAGAQQPEPGGEGAVWAGFDDGAPAGVYGVMVGRAAYNAPWASLADADRAVFGAAENAAASRRQVLEEYTRYADSMLGRWATLADGHRVPSVRQLTKPLLGMFHNEPHGKQWRTAVDEVLRSARSVREVLDGTLHVLRPETLDAPPPRTPVRRVPLPAFDPELPPSPAR